MRSSILGEGTLVEKVVVAQWRKKKKKCWHQVLVCVRKSVVAGSLQSIASPIYGRGMSAGAHRQPKPLSPPTPQCHCCPQLDHQQQPLKEWKPTAAFLLLLCLFNSKQPND
ncbi:hypothetical protein C4D60_Mb07t18620 [Musa balbisiana]|uniref:Uncharacterized protein n=1 Tax=Musa balbisiana TaxID=52838 RepID=A0A4S8JGZ4_MUSBA|nr:hypothetical protein C4D60_Mb07t18620 [Musa balbisiana]